MLRQALRRFGQKLVRRRPLEKRVFEYETGIKMSTLDLVALGVCRTVGVGVYFLANEVASNQAGPSIVICFLVAGLTSLLAGLCYAELSARVPHPGSAYLYSYVTMGELWAFITGWNLILSFVADAFIMIQAWFLPFDILTGTRISETQHESISEQVPQFFADNVKYLFVLFLFFFMEIQYVGFHGLLRIFQVFTLVKLLVLSFIIISGFIKGDLHNWNLTEKDYVQAGLNDSSRLGPLGSGGFMPFGFQGLLRGSASCFYTFIGFSVIVTRVKESHNPQHSIPMAIVVSLLICFLVYMSFTFPISVVIYMMAKDRLLFPFLARIRTGTYGYIVVSVMFIIIAAIMIFFFGLIDLLDLRSIGTLISYSLVAFCVLIVRYQPERRKEENEEALQGENEGDEAQVQEENGPAAEKLTLQGLFFPGSPTPTPLSGRIVYVCSSLLALLLTLLCLVLAHWPGLLSGDPGPITVVVLLLALITGVTGMTAATWLRFGVWMLIGFAIYLSYGIQQACSFIRT
ncbi:cationic amino acid transporter 3-like [Ailuropoda melanoleuca]|uniref:cationic amino acid transporter 3-like n=1 Tax=Ailuropoda melanoleuca TaxID=9646 RepID=UPI00149490C3|nr:cationic amino acid transporter 3-like [Ailuropoda melanoleuca]